MYGDECIMVVYNYNFIPSLFHAFMPSISLIFLHIFIDIIALIGDFGHLAVFEKGYSLKNWRGSCCSDEPTNRPPFCWGTLPGEGWMNSSAAGVGWKLDV